MAWQSLQDAQTMGLELVISTQILREYLAASTRPSPTNLPLNDILTNINVFQTQFQVVNDNLAVLAILTHLCQVFTVAGKQIHDANIVATMQVYQVNYLLTHNSADFKRFDSLITIIPLAENLFQ
jgi:predicted nucleic acid-binding protein